MALKYFSTIQRCLWVLSLILRTLPNFSLEPYTNISDDPLALSIAWGEFQDYTYFLMWSSPPQRVLFISSNCVMISTARYVLIHFGQEVFSGWNLIMSFITEFWILNTNTVTHPLKTFILPMYLLHLFEQFWLSPEFSTSAVLSFTYCYPLFFAVHFYVLEVIPLEEKNKPLL